jgi:four helix bundle protein
MGFRDTIVYQKSLDLVDICTDVSARIPSKDSFISDQLMRASASITLNFSEGCGRSSPGDRRVYFTRARGSAHEVQAALDVALRLRVVTEAPHKMGVGLADELAAMLTRFP